MRRLGGLDSLFVALETSDHPLHTMAVLVLDPSTIPNGYDFERMRDFIAGRVPAIPPLRRRLVPTPWNLARSHWVEADIDIAEHVHRIGLRDGALADVLRYAADIDAVPLDRSRPLWEMRFVDGLSDGSVVLVAKVHHALMDGAAGMEFMASMFSFSAEVEDVGLRATEPERPPAPIEILVRAAPEIAAVPARYLRALAKTAKGWVRSRRPERAAEPAGERARAPRVSWNRPLSERRALATTSLPLGDVKAAAHTSAVTVNDVVLAVLGGACRSYLAAHHELPDRSLIAAVPVSVRGGDTITDANAVSLMLTTLGTDIEDPLARLAAVHAATTHAKHQHRNVGDDLLASWLDVAPPVLFDAISRLYTALDLSSLVPPIVNLLVSNVPGPQARLYLGGARLRALYPLGPVYDGVGLNVTVVSAEERIDFGLVACPDVLADISELAREIRTSFDELVAARPEMRRRGRAAAVPA